MNILFVDKVMWRACEGAPRGVELFNLNLLRELVACGRDVTAILHPSWHPYVQDINALHLLPGTPDPKSGLFTALGSLRGKRYDVLLLGNVANRLLASIIWLRVLRLCKHCVLLAHRQPSRRVLFVQKHFWPTSVIVAVNQVIAQQFRAAGFARVFVYYGVTQADQYLTSQPARDDDSVDFCVVGNLDNAWKGADTAVAAFRQLPTEVQKTCHLHLASFPSHKSFPEENIHCYDWQPAAAMPGFLARMDVMIVPSRDEHVMRETFSQAMVQGMLSGLPIITTRLPILTEKLDQGGGMVCDTVADMAHAMVTLASDPQLRLRLGREARETAQQRYIWDTHHFVQKYLQQSCGHGSDVKNRDKKLSRKCKSVIDQS